jgi:CheY-like chemotaxis protein
MNPTSRSVLLVDDHPEVRKGLRTLFEAKGFTCFEANDGAEALQQAGKLNPDIIILDFSMPVMNGLEAASRLNKILPNTPVIMFTMYASEGFARRAVAAGIAAVFSKDQAGSHLLPKAMALLESTPK